MPGPDVKGVVVSSWEVASKKFLFCLSCTTGCSPHSLATYKDILFPSENWCMQSGTTSHSRTCSLMPDNVWGVLGKFDQLDGHILSRQEKGAKCKGYAYFRNLGCSHKVKVSYWLKSYSKSNRDLYQRLTETFDYAATRSYAIPVQK